MTKKERVQLTDSAKKRLASLLDSYSAELLEVLEREKFVPGEEITEVTASDIDDAEWRLRHGRTRRINSRKLMVRMSVVVGALLVLLGVMYPTLRESLGNPVQLVLIVVGLYFAAVGLLLYQTLAARYPQEYAEDHNLREKTVALERDRLILLERIAALERDLQELKKMY